MTTNHNTLQLNIVEDLSTTKIPGAKPFARTLLKEYQRIVDRYIESQGITDIEVNYEINAVPGLGKSLAVFARFGTAKERDDIEIDVYQLLAGVSGLLWEATQNEYSR